MKKLFASLSVVLLALVLSVSLSACVGAGGGGTGKEPELAPFVSYEEVVYLAAAGENYNVSVVYFRSETPKKMDGKVSEPVVGKIRISYVPLKLGGIDETVTFRYADGEGTLEKSKIRFELTGEFETDRGFSVESAETRLTLSIAGQEETVDLTKFENTIGADEALNLATKELSETLRPEIDAGFQREIMIKIIPDALGDTPYYYYVSFFASPEKFSAVLIDPAAKKVVAKKM